MDFFKRTWVEIDLDAIRHNFNIVKSKVQSSKIMAVLKANAYGHGAKVLARVYDELSCDWFAVSNIEEAIELRKLGIKRPILILGYTPTSEAKTLAEFDISQSVFCAEYAKALQDCAKKADVKVKVHIKADTGMGRIGFNCRSEEAIVRSAEEIAECAAMDNFIFEGLFTHFATADKDGDPDGEFTAIQYERYRKTIDLLKQKGITPELCHCCNSAGLMLHSDMHDDMVRPGIILYGLEPSPELKLGCFKPAMTFKTTVSMVKQLDIMDTVSYGCTYRADRQIIAATLPVGYADGYPRQLSNRGRVLINGKYAPVIGRVCMDQMVVDVTGIEGVAPGTQAVLFGKMGDKDLPVEEIARLCNTINYEIVCNISRRVPRVYLSGGKTVAVEDYLI
ncbi:MAG TPA: alanine racemase [Clostridiales bacterium]|nr:alanine racemase [Clostridiales bacterium]